MPISDDTSPRPRVEVSVEFARDEKEMAWYSNGMLAENPAPPAAASEPTGTAQRYVASDYAAFAAAFPTGSHSHLHTQPPTEALAVSVSVPVSPTDESHEAERKSISSGSGAVGAGSQPTSGSGSGSGGSGAGTLLLGAVALGSASKTPAQQAASPHFVAIESLSIVFYSGAFPFPAQTDTSSADLNFDPENTEATMRKIHRVPGVNKIVRLITHPTVLRSDTKIPFRITLPANQTPTIIMQEPDVASSASVYSSSSSSASSSTVVTAASRQVLVGSSCFVFVVMRIKNTSTNVIEPPIICGREVIVRKYRVYPQNMSDLVSIKYHVKESVVAPLENCLHVQTQRLEPKRHLLRPVDAFLLMNRFYKINKPDDLSSSSSPKILLKINDWNPAIRIISATCTWTETVKHNSALIAETVSSYHTHNGNQQELTQAQRQQQIQQTWLMNQLHNPSSSRSRTILRSHIAINPLYHHSSHSHYLDSRAPQKPFIHEFPVPLSDIRASFDRSNAFVTVEHSVGVGIEFCVDGAENGALMLEFRRAVNPQFGYFGDPILIGPVAANSPTQVGSSIHGVGSVDLGERSSLSDSISLPQSFFGINGSGRASNMGMNSSGGSRFNGAERKLNSFFTSIFSSRNTAASSSAPSVPGGPLSTSEQAEAPVARGSSLGSAPGLSMAPLPTQPQPQSRQPSLDQVAANPAAAPPKKFGVISVKPDDSQSGSFFRNASLDASTTVPPVVPTSSATATSAPRKFGIISVKPDDSKSSSFFEPNSRSSVGSNGAAAGANSQTNMSAETAAAGSTMVPPSPTVVLPTSKKSFGIISVRPDASKSSSFFTEPRPATPLPQDSSAVKNFAATGLKLDGTSLSDASPMTRSSDAARVVSAIPQQTESIDAILPPTSSATPFLPSPAQTVLTEASTAPQLPSKAATLDDVAFKAKSGANSGTRDENLFEDPLMQSPATLPGTMSMPVSHGAQAGYPVSLSRFNSLTETEPSVVHEPSSVRAPSVADEVGSSRASTNTTGRGPGGISIETGLKSMSLASRLQNTAEEDEAFSPYITLQNHTYFIVAVNLPREFPGFSDSELLSCSVGDMVTVMDIGEGDMMWCENVKTKMTGYVHVSKMDLTRQVEPSKPSFLNPSRLAAHQPRVTSAFDPEIRDDEIPIEILLESQLLAETGGPLADDEIPESVLLESLKDATAVATGSWSNEAPVNESRPGPSNSSENSLPTWLVLAPGDSGDRMEVAIYSHVVSDLDSDLLNVFEGESVGFNLKSRRGDMFRGINFTTNKDGYFPIGILGSRFGGLAETPVGDRDKGKGVINTLNNKGKAPVYSTASDSEP
ncbi:hypothetical protein HDU81_009046 [Chytriomyces hyalinus]|nr:hypothetical protein HDU81_009046 [Chytriomyces hyalinus]